MFTLRVAKVQPDYVTVKERYKVDLPLQMATCEANYLRLNKLLTHVTHDECPLDVCRLMTSCGQQQSLHLFQVLERSPYTTTLQLSQVLIDSPSAWLKMPRLTVRMYHDAKLAEVLAWEGHKRLRPRYEYPNQAMYLADEKHQLNQFLGEWLALCLAEGHSVDKVIAPQDGFL